MVSDPVFTVPVQLRAQHCIRCGIVFAMPAEVDEQRQKDFKSFYCPRGHRMAYLRDKSLVERQKLILEIHEREQAEAREADAAVPAPAEDNRPETLKEKACPKCGRVYRSLTCFQKHLRFVCKVEA